MAYGVIWVELFQFSISEMAQYEATAAIWIISLCLKPLLWAGNDESPVFNNSMTSGAAHVFKISKYWNIWLSKFSLLSRLVRFPLLWQNTWANQFTRRKDLFGLTASQILVCGHLDQLPLSLCWSKTSWWGTCGRGGLFTSWKPGSRDGGQVPCSPKPL